jgi:hypothetical protein
MAFEGWTDGIPPVEWPRVLAMDVGGATANALEWGAKDPVSHSLVMYDEINVVTTDMRLVAEQAKPKMKTLTGEEYHFLFKVIDHENRIAGDDMARHGLRFTNAVKQNKALSIHRLSGYLHPNPLRPFPIWHPRAGQLGSPLLFIMSPCKNLIKELPVQKWKTGEGDMVKDEMDRTIRHDAVDCLLYIARLLPAPVDIPILKVKAVEDPRSIQSRLYWADVKKHAEKMSEAETRRKYNPGHGGGTWGVQSRLQ